MSYMSAQGSLVNRRVCAYAQELYALTAAGFSEAEAVAMTDEASAENATVVPIKTDTTGIPTGYLVYCQFALYALFGGVCVIVGTGLNSLRQDDVRRRILERFTEKFSAANEAAFNAGVEAGKSLIG